MEVCVVEIETCLGCVVGVVEGDKGEPSWGFGTGGGEMDVGERPVWKEERVERGVCCRWREIGYVQMPRCGRGGHFCFGL